MNRILEQVVGIVGFDSCSYRVMLDCFITGLFGHLQNTLQGVGGMLSISRVMKIWSTSQLVYITEDIWLERLSDWRIWWVEV